MQICAGTRPEPVSRTSPGDALLMGLARSLWDYRGYVRASVARDLRLRYAGSVLGALWQILAPLALIATYTLVFSELMRAHLRGIDDRYAYAIYVCCALLPWTAFTEILTRSQTMFLDHANLLKKSNFPRICVPATVTGAALANFAIVYGVFLALLVVSSHWPGIVVFGTLVPLAILAVFGASLGVLLGIAHVFFRDVGQILAILLQIWFWAAPIAYPSDTLPPPYDRWIAANPVTPIVVAFQDIFVHRQWPAWVTLVYPAIVCAVLALLALAAFRRESPQIVDEL